VELDLNAHRGPAGMGVEDVCTQPSVYLRHALARTQTMNGKPNFAL
jgi:hypothetical protein